MPAPDSTAVNAMFGRIAWRYDLANRLLSVGIDRKWRSRLVRAVRRGAPPGPVLDLATGSGDVAFALSRGLAAGTPIVGADFCLPMLAEAEKKLAAAGPGAYSGVRFVPGDGLNLPFPDGTFAAATISFGLRNMADRPRCLAELRRVLLPGGHLFVLEFSRPRAWLRPGYYFYLRRVLPLLAGWLTRDRDAYRYLNRTIEEFPGAEALTAEIRSAGFAEVEATRLSAGIVALHEAVKGPAGPGPASA